MSREAIRVEHDGASRLVWPCSVPGCGNLCDLDYDSLFVRSGHLAMVPNTLLAEIDWAFAEVMDGALPSSVVTDILNDALRHAVEADAVINGDGLSPTTKCSVCGEDQFWTPSGDSCKNGHGSAEPAA